MDWITEPARKTPVAANVDLTVRGQVLQYDSAAKPPRFWDQRVEGEGLIVPSSALGG